MKNPLVEKIEKELKQLEIEGAKLISESYSEEHFGDAVVDYKLGDLYLRFNRDRSCDTIDFINPFDKNILYIFDNISLVMGWVNLEEMIAKVKSMDFSKPPTGPIPLSEALGLIKKHFEQLQRMFSKAEMDATHKKLEEVSKKRSKELFG